MDPLSGTVLLHDATGDLIAKLVYLGAEPGLCVRHLERLFAALAPGLASEIRRVPGDGQYLSRDNEIVFFDFAPVMRGATGALVALRLHLYALAAPPTEADLAFLLKSVDVLLFVRVAGVNGEDALFQAASRATDESPPIGVTVIEESRGPVGPSTALLESWLEVRTNVSTGVGVVEALKLATNELLRLARG